jgi:hypothetical protein
MNLGVGNKLTIRSTETGDVRDTWADVSRTDRVLTLHANQGRACAGVRVARGEERRDS